MGLIAAFAASFVLWVVLWALGIKAFDGIWIVFWILLTAVVVRIVVRYLPGRSSS